MDIKNLNIQDVLLSNGYVTEEDIKKAQKYADSHHETVVDYLLKSGILTKKLLGQAVAESFTVSFSDLNVIAPTKELVLKIPQEIAQKHHVVVVSESETTVVIATDNPKNLDLNSIVSKIFPGKTVVTTYAFLEDLEQVFINYKQSLEARFVKIITSEKKVAPEILEQIFNDAIIYRASDVHFEPRGKDVFTRFRIDGVLHEVGVIPSFYYENILNRIKVQAKLKIDEHFSAQDGSLSFLQNNNSIDIRVSIIPTLTGEKVVLRILSQYLRTLTLSELGLSENDVQSITAAAKKPFGMVLVTGPTGSGKTTTLYGLLKELNHPEINITTIEDPVEYRIPTMNQIQVNSQTNLTFSKGLKSILRQDPDIILVGEIRDKDTAEVAINAALTGHLLFSTFHANNATSAIPRLLDIGLESFLVASTLEIVVAQRLLRRICESCRFSFKIKTKDILRIYPFLNNYLSSDSQTFYQGKGCSVCNQTGYKGRIGIYEILKVTQEIRELIASVPTSGEVLNLANKQGFKSLFEDGLVKVKNGFSTLEELIRVAPPTV